MDLRTLAAADRPRGRMLAPAQGSELVLRLHELTRRGLDEYLELVELVLHALPLRQGRRQGRRRHKREDGMLLLHETARASLGSGRRGSHGVAK